MKSTLPRFLLSVCVPAVALAAVLAACPAKADPDGPTDPLSVSYLNSVRGFIPGTQSQLLHLGWRTCGLLYAGFTPITLSNPEVMYTNIPGTPMLTSQQATIMVESAMDTLCPGAPTNGIGVGHPGTNACE
ncbi:MAG: DUF732 domain-containing protein [Mycobacterium sp.]|uniref:DUF732 domain-containing protein n=1 Tax=Mycobacterium sp. TaxID=1785 RepID=UPI003F9EA948